MEDLLADSVPLNEDQDLKSIDETGPGTLYVVASIPQVGYVLRCVTPPTVWAWVKPDPQ
jgi:hypothetical protein